MRFLALLTVCLFATVATSATQEEAADKIAEAYSYRCSGIIPPDITYVSRLRVEAHNDVGALTEVPGYLQIMLDGADAAYDRMAAAIATANGLVQSGNTSYTTSNTAYNAGDWDTAYDDAQSAVNDYIEAQGVFSYADSERDAAESGYLQVSEECYYITELGDMGGAGEDWDFYESMMLLEWLYAE